MGWWKVEGTGAAIGDGPLDTLSGAVASVLSQYQQTFGRKPDKTEWEALLFAVLGSEEPEERTCRGGAVKRVIVEVG